MLRVSSHESFSFSDNLCDVDASESERGMNARNDYLPAEVLRSKASRRMRDPLTTRQFTSVGYFSRERGGIHGRPKWNAHCVLRHMENGVLISWIHRISRVFSKLMRRSTYFKAPSVGTSTAKNFLD